MVYDDIARIDFGVAIDLLMLFELLLPRVDGVFGGRGVVVIGFVVLDLGVAHRVMCGVL